MWRNFKLRLGKIVQSALNIFRKKDPQSLVGKQVTIQNGELYIDGEAFGKILAVEKLSLEEFEKTDYPAIIKNDAKWECSFEMEMSDEEKELLEKLANTHESLLPKRHQVPTLIVSTYASWDYDSVGVDISQLEETGIAHFFCTTTKTMEEAAYEFHERHPESEPWDLDGEQSASVIVKDAALIQIGDYWTWE